MNSSITTLDPINTATHAKAILSHDGFRCTLFTLAPGDELSRPAEEVDEHVLFVVDGEVTLRIGKVNTILAKEQAHHIAKGQHHAIAAHASGWAKVLRVDVPPRQVVTPQILTFK